MAIELNDGQITSHSIMKKVRAYYVQNLNLKISLIVCINDYCINYTLVHTLIIPYVINNTSFLIF